MDITRMPADPAAYLAAQATNTDLAALIRTAADILIARGIDLDPVLADRVDEAVLEKLAREPGGLSGVTLPAAYRDVAVA